METKIKNIPLTNDQSITIEDLPEIGLQANVMCKYILVHHYDVGDNSVVFSFDGLTPQEVKDIAAYIQFKAENLLGDTVSLKNRTIVHFLEMHGAKFIDECVLNKEDFNPVGMILIDMYEERESKLCGNNWYAENYDSFDLKYSEIATNYLLKISKGQSLDGALF